jgi:MATE family multidrug resistance protein
MITQVGFFMMNVVDAIMSGRVSAEDLAGVAIGSSLWMPVFTGINGILLAVTPIISQQLGAGKTDKIANSVTQAVYLSICLAAAVIVVGAITLDPVLVLMDLSSEVHYIAKHYLVGLAFGIFPLFAASVLRYFFDSLGHTRITMFVILLTIPINVLLNYLLIFGVGIFPRLGGIGAGYATALSYWIMLGFSILFLLFLPKEETYEIFTKKVKPSLQAWWEQLKIGIPMGLSIFFEASIFAAVTLLMSQFSTNIIAAHQAAMNVTSLIFMVPLSISMALTIVVGYEVGAKRIHDAVEFSKIGISMAIFVLLLGSGFLYLFRDMIASIYSNEQEVMILIQQFLIFAIFYQISDAAQASIQGVLRGYKDVMAPFIMALISYWILGIPAGYVLANYTFLGPFGYWLGITCGLTAAAVGFSMRLVYIQKRYERALT